MVKNGKLSLIVEKGILTTAFIVVVILILSSLALDRIKEQINYETQETLHTILHTTHKSVKLWVEDKIDDAQLMVNRPDVRQFATELLSLPRNKEALTDSPSQQKLRAIIRPWLERHSDLGLFIIMRTQHYVRALAEYLATQPKYSDYLDHETIDLMFKSAPLHDIGKVGVPDSILLKPGSLNEEEWDEMKKHTLYGRDAILKAEKQMGAGQTSFLRFAREIAASHHEKWDGSGYPYGLIGEDIPLSGRLMIMADIYDALISKRVYKPAFSHERAVQIITEGDGRVMPVHFDPYVLEGFIKLQKQFHQIALKYLDNDEDQI